MLHQSGLGRGLNSLIPTKKPATAYVTDPKLHETMAAADQIRHLDVNIISPNPYQPRKVFDADALQGLADSIRQHGVIQPIIVSQKAGGLFELIAGERRLRAAKLAGLKTIPAIIRELSEQKKIEFALIENVQRANLNPLEVAFAYKKLEDEFNLTHAEIGKRVGKSVSVIQNHLYLLNLRDEVKDAIMAGQLTEGHARTLVALPYEDQLEGMQNIIAGRMTVRQAEKARREVVMRKNIRPVRIDLEVQDMGERLSATLGTRALIRRHGGVGQILIKFFSNEELNSIMNKLLK